MALTAKQRAALPDSAFALPKTREFPIPDQAHAQLALRMLDQQPADVQERIKRAVRRKYPKMRTATVPVMHGKITGGPRKT